MFTRPANPRRPAQALSHGCAAVGCQHQVPLRLLMCNDHWRQVPKVTQGLIWKYYREIGRRPGADEDYRVAVQTAVDAVRNKQLKAKDRRDGATKPLF